ncbi:MAG: acetyl-CoA carboxylase carboxyltransferase subunit alpha [Candidatus Latescibacteria bacterium]|nr:acetyl-CoA carboxylase carboxyltransferase subunit alpha [Candidatus Latescibacterota bacterium]
MERKSHVLDFERPLHELERKIEELKAHAESEGLDVSDELSILVSKARKLEQEIYSNLTRWQVYQLAKHPERPHTLDYLQGLLTDFVELHGDRGYRDDPAIVGGLGKLEGRPLVVVGHQKGRNTGENIRRNFGMAHPEGYRKALRLMKLAAKFRRPVLCLIDTPGAHPGIGSEERSVSEAIARNLVEIFRLPIPIVVAIIGEGASGGAIGIGVGDKILMLENAWYSVINPESCSLILWRNRENREEAAEALRITAPDLLELGIIDGIVPEPFGGAHRNPEETVGHLGQAVTEAFEQLSQVPSDELVSRRIEKFRQMGIWEE